MADTEQLERLKRSVTEWNLWRQEHPHRQPDLSRANLTEANLSLANLTEANLTLANLSRANLFWANLSRARLEMADLTEAHLLRAHLTRANLTSTTFTLANLYWADLSEADLSRTNFTRTYFWNTFFVQVDLSQVLGLEAAIYNGPSTVNINSVVLPHNEQTRIQFLRGVGFSDTFIEYLPSLLTSPVQYSSVFLSYSQHDEAFTKRLHNDLQDQGVRCWFAPHDLRPGELIRKGIDEAIHRQDKLLLVLSEYSVKSGWVGYEVETALSREIRELREILFPIRIDDAIFRCTAPWAICLRDLRHIGDFRQWAEPEQYQQVFQRLLRDLKANDAQPRKPE